MSKKNFTIGVVGLGYVGLPLACLLSKNYTVNGFDINQKKISDLKNGVDETGEVQDLTSYAINYATDPAILKECQIIIVAVPTPITQDKKPDLRPLQSASEIVGKNLSKGAIVVYESTVYPGCTEEDCLPLLIENSGLKYPQDFNIGYSPERINPGDKVNTIDKITKIVSADNEKTLEVLAEVYGSFTTVHKATSIKVAEAAKVIENVQRSLNIALMNELAIIFDKLGISSKDVLAAAGTKWNFHQYTPGLVGGHCIGIDPYYLTHKAQQLGYEPKVILSGQEVNEYMVELVASKFKSKKNILIMGLTFKENVPDLRNSKAIELFKFFKEQDKRVTGIDPVVDLKQAPLDSSDYSWYGGGSLPSEDDIKEKFDGVIVFSPHRQFIQAEYSLENLKKICESATVLFDIKGMYDQQRAVELGFNYQTL